MRAAALLLGVSVRVGCASPAPAGRTLVPVPVECREPVPDQPAFWGTQTSSTGTQRVVWARKVAQLKR